MFRWYINTTPCSLPIYHISLHLTCYLLYVEWGNVDLSLSCCGSVIVFVLLEGSQQFNYDHIHNTKTINSFIQHHTLLLLTLLFYMTVKNPDRCLHSLMTISWSYLLVFDCQWDKKTTTFGENFFTFRVIIDRLLEKMMGGRNDRDNNGWMQIR